MKVRILSGSQAGAVLDMPDAEAVQNVSSGFAELVPEVPVAGISTTLDHVTVSVPAVRAEAPRLRATAAKASKPAKGVVKRKRA